MIDLLMLVTKETIKNQMLEKLKTSMCKIDNSIFSFNIIDR